MAKDTSGRYTLYYSFQNREHTIQFPAKDLADAKLRGQAMFAATQLVLYPVFQEFPVFIKFEDPNGKLIRGWKP